METGTIKRIVSDRGFGFITVDGGRGRGDDMFFHRTSVADPGGFESLQEGQRVEFEQEHSPKGPRAGNVRRV